MSKKILQRLGLIIVILVVILIINNYFINIDGFNVSSKSVIMAVNSLSYIYYTNNISTSTNWSLVPGGLKSISYSNNQAVGTNYLDDIFYTVNPSSPDWKQIPGKLTDVSFDGYAMVLVGVTPKNDILYSTTFAKGDPAWKQIDGKLKNVCYSNKQLAGVNSLGDIYYTNNYTNPDWKQIPGNLSQLSFDGYDMVIVGVSPKDDLIYSTTFATGDPAWKQIYGKLTNVSYSNKQLAGVNSLGDVYYANNYTNPDWIQIPGNMLKLSFEASGNPAAAAAQPQAKSKSKPKPKPKAKTKK